MASVNKVILIGNLGKDPELKYTPSGQPVATFSLATSERWNDRTGKPQERTEWHNIVVWGKQGESAHQYLKKGRSAYIEGRITNRSWDDRDGNKRYKTEIIAQRVQFLGGPAGSGGGAGAPPEAHPADTAPPEDFGPAPDAVAEPQAAPAPEDDLPF